MNARSQRLCAWCGPFFTLLFFIGFGVIAGFIPPPLPSSSAEVIATMYRDHATAIRLGMVLSMFAITFWVPFIAIISVQLKRIEGRHSPMTYAQLALGALNPVAFFPAFYYFCTAAFRPERDDKVIQQLNDMGWLPFTGIVYVIFVQNLVIGIAVLSDSRSTPILPRWYGYFSIWAGVLYCPACLDVFFQKGPLAWDGIFTWWLSLVAFFVWIVVTTVVMLRAITSQEKSEGIHGAVDSDVDPIKALQSHVDALRAELEGVRKDLSPTS